MDKGFVTVKHGKTSIVCRAEDVASIMSSLNGTTKPAEKVYEKSAVIRKAIRNIKAETAEDLVLSSLVNRDGLHTVISGLNQEIRDRFELDPVVVTSDMIKDGLIKGRPAKRGFWIYK